MILILVIIVVLLRYYAITLGKLICDVIKNFFKDKKHESKNNNT